MRAQTGGGSIALNGVPSARAETGAGGIVAKFVSGTERTDSVLETSAGDITVYLAPELNMTIRASIDLANGHRIRSDFSEIRVSSEGGEWGPGSATAEGNLNGGGPVLKVRTTTGNINFVAPVAKEFSGGGTSMRKSILGVLVVPMFLALVCGAQRRVPRNPSLSLTDSPAKTLAAERTWGWILAT